MLINIDKSGASKAGIEDFNAAGHNAAVIEVRQRKRLNNIVEQDHRQRVVLGDIQLVHMLRKGQIAFATGEVTLRAAAAAFYELSAA